MDSARPSRFQPSALAGDVSCDRHVWMKVNLAGVVSGARDPGSRSEQSVDSNDVKLVVISLHKILLASTETPLVLVEAMKPGGTGDRDNLTEDIMKSILRSTSRCKKNKVSMTKIGRAV